MKNLIFIAALLLALNVNADNSDSGYEDINSLNVGPCSGTATKCFTVYMSGWKTEFTGCQTTAAASCNIEEDFCKSLYSGLLAAKLANKKVRIFSHGATCNVRGNNVGIVDLTYYEM